MVKSGQVTQAQGKELKAQLTNAAATVAAAEAQVRRVASPQVQQAAREMASTRDGGLSAAMNARLNIEKLAPKPLGLFEAGLAGLSSTAAMGPLVTQMENIAGARGRIAQEIAGLEGKPNRTEGQTLLLEAKRQQGDALDAASGVLRSRIETLRATSNAALNTEQVGGKAFTKAELDGLAAATRATDLAAAKAAIKGRGADAAVALALAQVQREQATTSAGAPGIAQASADATGVPAPTAGEAPPAGGSVTIKEGDWLTKVAAGHKNADGSRVTLEQLLDTPGNEKFRKNPNLIHPGDVVTLPKGALSAAAFEAAKAKAAGAPSSASLPGPANAGGPARSERTAAAPGRAELDASIQRSNAQMKTVNDVRQAALDDGVGGLDARVDAARISEDADAVIARHGKRLEALGQVGKEIDAEIKTLTKRPSRSPGEEALLGAKRAQRSEVDTLVTALRGNVESLQQLKKETADGAIDGAEARAMLERTRAKNTGLATSASAGLQASDQLAEAYRLLEAPAAR